MTVLDELISQPRAKIVILPDPFSRPCRDIFGSGLFQQLFPDHGVAAFGALDGGAFYPLPVRYFSAAFGANTITAHAEAAAMVPATAPAVSQAFPRCIVVSENSHSVKVYLFSDKDNEHKFKSQ